MARIDLDHIRHAYTAEPEVGCRLRAEGGAPHLRGRRRLCAARAVGLRQDHAAQHHFGADPSLARAAAVRRPDVTGLSTQERNIAQVFQFPVIYDTMTVYDNLAFPLRNRGVPEAEVDRKVREILDMIGLADRAQQAGARADRRPEAEDLARPRPGALRRQRHPVRRAADRHRPAYEMGAALAAEAAAPPLRLHDGLRHARPDRGADLRRPGRRHVRGRDRADRHAGRTVRAAAAHLRRLFHRLAGHERHAGRGRRQDGQARRADDRAAGHAGRQCRAPSSSASGRNIVRLGREGMPVIGAQGRGYRPPQDRARQPRRPRDRGDRRRGRGHPGRSEGRASIPAGINLYADSWRVEMGA